MTAPLSRPTVLALAVLLLGLLGLLVGACSGGSPDRPRSAASRPTSPATSPTPSVTPVPKPRQDACYRLSPDELTRSANESRPVPCSTRHTARTVYVGRLRTVVQGHAIGVDSAAVQRQLATTCPKKLAAFLGGSQRTRRLSRLEVVWFSPTLTAADRGDAWFRCDLVAFDDADSLLPLPTTGPLRGALDDSRALDDYGLCGTAAPGTAGFRRVICRREHSWQAVDPIDLAGGATYPGAAKVRKQGEPLCKARARARASDTLKFRYGWEWPTATQWKAGQHYGFCWVPST